MDANRTTNYKKTIVSRFVLLFFCALTVACSKDDAQDRQKAALITTDTNKELSAEQLSGIDEFCKARHSVVVQATRCKVDQRSAASQLFALENVQQSVIDKCSALAADGFRVVLNCAKADGEISIPHVPAKPAHNYSMEEDGEYGYERALSSDDTNAGRATAPIMMFRYLGIKNDVHTVQSRNGATVQTVSCKAPCEFVKIKSFYQGSLINTETVRASPDSIIGGVLSDAQNGMLTPYKKSPGT